MTIGITGRNLIFLISQPRAGSTLTQRLLANHPDIHTVSEPWLMLHPIYSIRSKGYSSEYNSDLALIGLNNFLQTGFDGEGEENYIQGIRMMYSALYNSSLNSSSKKMFLDKTPRYYLIIPELYRIFPEAKFVFLFRHPLAVMVSHIKEGLKGIWDTLSGSNQDLMYAPELLVAGSELIGNNCFVMNYEVLLFDPEKEMHRLCNYLNVEFDQNILYYQFHEDSGWLFGDHKTLY